MRILHVFFSLYFLLLSFFSFADDVKPGGIKGRVKLSDGKPAAYVSVSVKGTSKGSFTEEDGTFTIRNINPGTYELEVSLAGYQNAIQSVTVSNDATAEVTFTLNINAQELQEVVVRTGSSGYKSNRPSSTLRLNEPLNEIAQNIQIITNKSLADQQLISMSDGVVRNVSGAIRNEHWADIYTNITVRGSQIQAFRNGFNVVNSYWGPLTEDMSFVDHIEFVKGPAGFMLANGDPSGLYNVVTKKPTGVTKGEVEFTTGSFGLYRSTLDLDGKLSKDGRLLYRLNLMGQNKGSFRPNEYNNRYSIAPVISCQVDDKTKLTLEYTLQHAKMSNVGSYYVFSPNGYATLPRNYTMLPAGLAPTIIDDHSIFLNVQHQISDNWKLTAQGAYFNYQQPEGSSMWPAAVNTDGAIQRGVSSWFAKSNMTLAQAFVNGDINTGTVHHRILGGIDIGTKNYFADWGQYHLLDTVAVSTATPLTGIPSNGYPSFTNDKSTLEQRAVAVGGTMDMNYTSIYIQDELGFFNNTARLTLAGRYTKVNQSYGQDRDSAEHFTPRVGLSVSVDKSTSVYAVYDQAFLPQSGRLSNGGKPQPLTGNNMEIGIKKDWANGNWNTTIAAYRILKNNELTADPNSPPTSGLSIELGQKRSQGIEFDLRGRIVNGLNLVANYALTDSKVTKVTEGVTVAKEGDVVPGFAKHTVNAWLTYKFQGGALKGVGISGGFSYLAGRKTYWEASPDADKQLPDYFKLDGGVFWEGGKMRIAANVFNILDKYLYSGSYYSWLNAYYWQADPPRNVRFSISYKF